MASAEATFPDREPLYQDQVRRLENPKYAEELLFSNFGEAYDRLRDEDGVFALANTMVAEQAFLEKDFDQFQPHRLTDGFEHSQHLLLAKGSPITKILSKGN